MEPLVSILIPAYNAEKCIAQTLESALGQAWNNKEIIVVDDGSRDGTLALLQKYECRGVRVISQSNSGAAAARNRAFEAARGDYIQWLDSDDLLSPDKVALQVGRAMELGDENVLLSGGWAHFLVDPARARFAPTPLWEDLTPGEWLQRKMEGNLHMQTATWLVSRKLTAAAGPWNTNLLGDDDGEYFCRVIRACSRISFVEGAKVYYRISGSGSLSYLGASAKKLDAHFSSMKMHIDYLLELKNDAKARAACVTYLQNWLSYFYPERADIVAEAQGLARKLGGELQVPTLSWKYQWIQALFGWGAAKRTQRTYNSYKLKAKIAAEDALRSIGV